MNIRFNKHSICLLALFVFGNLIIAFPKGKGTQFSFSGLIICFAVSIVLCFLYARIQQKGLFDLSDNRDYNAGSLRILLKFVISLFCIISILITCKDYIGFVDSVRLPETSNTVISIIFVLLATVLANSKKKVIYLFGLISLIFTAITMLVMVVLSLPNMRFSYVTDYLKLSFSGTLNQALTYFIHSFGQVILVLFYIGKTQGGRTRKMQIWGLCIGTALLIICLFNCVSVLGPVGIDRVAYPYAEVTGMISYGKSFNRMDGFTYYIYFISSLLKSAVILKVFFSCLEQMPGLAKNILKGAALLVVVLFSTAMNLRGLLQSDLVNLTLLILEIAVPIILWLMYGKLKNKVKEQH